MLSVYAAYKHFYFGIRFPINAVYLSAILSTDEVLTTDTMKKETIIHQGRSF